MKNQQFYIDKYLVDVSRNQLVSNGQQFPLPPKTIAVLCLLAERQGEVISFEEILATIWHDRVVSVNTLQQCISQIRQTFNDDSAKQEVIRTHARKGYSLELPVTSIVPKSSSRTKQKFTSRKAQAVLSTFVLMLACFAIYVFLSNETRYQSYSHITPLTSTDAWESNGSFSPDGRFLLFQRHSDNCHSHIWLKEIHSHRESRLTSRPGVYGKASWSSDGNNITFAERNSCQLETPGHLFCWSVNTLNVIDAIQVPQKPVPRFDCKTQPTWNAQWLPSGAISFVQETTSKLAGIRIYDPKTLNIIDLPQQRKIYFYSHDFASTTNSFALLGIDENNHYWLDRITPDGLLLSSSRIQLPDHNGTPDGLTFHASEHTLLIEINNQPFKLEFDGKVTELEVATRNRMTGFDFAPSKDDLLATEVIADTDLLLIPNPTQTSNPTSNPGSQKTNPVPSELTSDNIAQLTLNRSNTSDDNGKFQPSGSRIAFVSQRTGQRQIWTLDDSELQQISELTSGNLEKSILWSPSGDRISGISDEKVIIWDLRGQEVFRSKKLVIQNLFQWLSEDRLLVNVRRDGESHLALLHLASQHLEYLHKTAVVWASFTDNNDLVYYDQNRQFWIQANDAAETIPFLSNPLEQPRAIIKGNILYGINPQFQLWSYATDSKEHNIIQQLPDSLRYVSDFNGDNFLLTHMQQLKKDLVLLSRQ